MANHFTTDLDLYTEQSYAAIGVGPVVVIVKREDEGIVIDVFPDDPFVQDTTVTSYWTWGEMVPEEEDDGHVS